MNGTGQSRPVYIPGLIHAMSKATEYDAISSKCTIVAANSTLAPTNGISIRHDIFFSKNLFFFQKIYFFFKNFIFFYFFPPISRNTKKDKIMKFKIKRSLVVKLRSRDKTKKNVYSKLVAVKKPVKVAV